VSYIIDSSVWIDFFRAASPAALKHQAAKLIEDERAMLCEPVLFELLRATPAAARKNVESQLDLLPLAPTPPRLWRDAAELGQKCFGRGFVPPAMDLLIAQVCLDQNLELITFDRDFAGIARVSSLRVRILDRASK
jgi:predicted nucleic acid-binding protein